MYYSLSDFVTHEREFKENLGDSNVMSLGKILYRDGGTC
jgi:hypothetical protein